MKRVCHNCVFNECGDGGYGSRCNMGNNETYEMKVCPSSIEASNFKCTDFRSVDEMRVMLDKDTTIY